MRELIQVAPSLVVVILLTAISWTLIFYGNYATRHFKSEHPRWFKSIVALLLGAAIFGLCVVLQYLWASPVASLPKDQLAADNVLRANRIQVIATVVQSLGGLAVLVGIYFAWANLKTTQDAQKTTQRNQAETLRLTNEGQITDRFTRAIDQLGSGQFEVRLGAIYALERIARDSAKDHWPIMEVLTAYVRVHAPVAEADANAPAAQLEPDIQAILTVIGRRERIFGNDEDERLDLRRTNLRGGHLDNAHLEGANLVGANLQGASLASAQLVDAFLHRANLSGANLNGVFLSDANLNGADLSGARLFSANLGFADLSGASLSGALLFSAILSNAVLYGANLSGAKPAPREPTASFESYPTAD